MILLTAFACADYAVTDKNNGAYDTAQAGTDSGGGDTEGDTGVAEPVPAWWSLAATVTVAGGSPDATTAVVTLPVVDVDGETVDCTPVLDATGLVEAASPDLAIAEWWTMPVVVAGESCATLPTELAFGIGQLDAEVRARLGQVGLDDSADALYGTYLQADGGTVYTVGYATAASSSGVAVEPPPDDTYTLVSLFLMPLP